MNELLTKQVILDTLTNYDELLHKAEDYVASKTNIEKRWQGQIRFINGTIEEERNTSCACHPQYIWEYIGTYEDFAEWLSKNERLV